ncbi:MAG: hypothetical protein Kow0010_06510 [Dehalococcoidia bacterium]
MSRLRSMRWPARMAWLFLLPVIAFGGAFVVARAVTGGDHEEFIERNAAYSPPDRFRPGQLRPDKVAEVVGFTDFPVLWLGETFDGYNLTAVQRANINDQERPGWPDGYINNSLLLVYGDCVPDTSGESPSCVPPLSITIQAGNIVPPIDEVDPGVGASAVLTVRGIQALELGPTTHLWFDNGMTVSVSGNKTDRDRAVSMLWLANAAALGMPEIGKDGGPLDAIGTFELSDPVTQVD